jgi:cell division protease FtsH
VTNVPAFGDDRLLELLEKNGVRIRVEPEPEPSPLAMALISLLPWVLLIGVGYAIFRRVSSSRGDLLSIGKSKAKLYRRSKEETTFDDVAGVDQAKTELAEIIEFLGDPARFRRLGGKPPKGVLLVGPPGTGKTLLARASAGEAGVPFYSITGSDFMEMFVGVGASRVRDLFESARRNAPSIVFIDEIDSIGRRRGSGIGGGHDEREQTLNQLLSEMDGFEPHENVIVMAATNRPDILDPALLRPGRFNRRVRVDLPSQRSRNAILEVHARGKPLDDRISLEALARTTSGFSGADLENLLNEASLIAARDGADEIGREHVDRARDKLVLGLEQEGVAISDDERKLIAYHEAGHAVTAASLTHSEPIHKVSIVPRERTMGATQFANRRDRYVQTREQLRDSLAVLLGGRAAEELFAGTATSGAEDDLKRATRIARKMVAQLGMSPTIGPLSFAGDDQTVFLGNEIAERRDHSEHTARLIDREVKRLVATAQRRVSVLLDRHERVVERVVRELLDREEVDGREVAELIEEARIEAA